MLNDNSNVTGELTIRVISPEGQVKEEKTVKNAVTTAGASYFTRRALAAVAGDLAALPAMSHMAVGTNNTSQATVVNGVPVVNNTSDRLGAEPADARSAFSGAPSISGNTITYTAEFGTNRAQPVSPATATAIVEAGIFNYSTALGSGATPTASQVMLARTIFPVVNKASQDVIQIVWRITVNPSGAGPV